MAHRQGLDDSSTNGALARAAVRNREVVDLHADAGAALLAKALGPDRPEGARAFGETRAGGGEAADDTRSFLSEQVMRENPASRGTETSAHS